MANGLFTTPAQVRAAQMAQLQQQGASGLGGSLFALGSTAGDAFQRGLFGTDTRSPEELQAIEMQALTQGIDATDRNSMLEGVKRLSNAGFQREAFQLAQMVPEAAKAVERKTYADVNGRRRFVDTGELVNPSVVKDPSDKIEGKTYQLLETMPDGSTRQIGTKFVKQGDPLPKIPTSDRNLAWAVIGTPRAGFNVDVTANAAQDISPFMETFGKELGKDFQVERESAMSSANSLRAQADAIKLLDKGVIAGTGANFITGLGKALMRLGLIDKTGDTATLIANTEAYGAQQAKQVAEIIKAFGAGTGLSDADREFATKAAAGEVTMNEEALRRIIDLNNKARRTTIRLYNKRAKEVMDRNKGAIPFDISVPLPDVNFADKVDPGKLSDTELLRQLGLD